MEEPHGRRKIFFVPKNKSSFWPGWTPSRLEGTRGHAKRFFLITNTYFLTTIDTIQAVEASRHTKPFCWLQINVFFVTQMDTLKKNVFFDKKCVFWPVTHLQGLLQSGQSRRSSCSSELLCDSYASLQRATLGMDDSSVCPPRWGSDPQVLHHTVSSSRRAQSQIAVLNYGQLLSRPWNWYVFLANSSNTT